MPFEHKRKTTDSVKQTAHRNRTQILCADALCQEVPERQGDRIAERLIARAVRCFVALPKTIDPIAFASLTIVPISYVRPAVRVALQPLAFQRCDPPHDHVLNDQIRAVLVVTLLAAARDIALAVIAEALHLIANRRDLAESVQRRTRLIRSDGAAVIRRCDLRAVKYQDGRTLIQPAWHRAQRRRAFLGVADAVCLCALPSLKGRA